MENINKIEEEEKELEELINCECHCHVTAPDPKYCECPFFECKHCIKDKVLDSLLKDIEELLKTPHYNKAQNYDIAIKEVLSIITQYKNGKE